MTDHQITTISVKLRHDEVIDEETEKINEALSKMGYSIKNRAQMYAPVLTGALVRDGRVLEGNLSVAVAFGGLAVPYGRRRHYENNLHPDTRRYLERAGNEAVKQGIQFYL